MPRFTIYVDDQHEASRQVKNFIEKNGLNQAQPWNTIGEGFLPVQLVVGHFREDFPEKLQPLSVPCVHHNAPDGVDQFFEGQRAFQVINQDIMNIARKLVQKYRTHQQNQPAQPTQSTQPTPTKLMGGGLTKKSSVGGGLKFGGQREKSNAEIEANTQRIMQERAQIQANKSQPTVEAARDSLNPTA